jgi:5-methylcytosine-specific restriction endonuclease McrA
MLFESTDGQCAYSCGRAATTLDHVIPVAAGGVTGPGLMVPACVPCNSRKRDGDPGPWIDRMTPDALSLIEPGLTYDGVLDLIG